MTVEIRGATLAERPAVQHLINLAYDAEPHGPSLAQPCISVGGSHQDPYDRAENTRVLYVDGQLISAMHVLVRETYVKGAQAHFGLITDVATHPEYRRRGFMRLLMTDTERYMRACGLSYGVLFGRLAWYGGSLGWHWNGEKQATLPTVLLLPPTIGPSAITSTPATEHDLPFLAQRYEARYARTFGPVVRTPDYWRCWSLPREHEGRYFVVWHKSTRMGYFHYGNGVDEVGWEETAHIASVLHAITTYAAQQHETQVKVWNYAWDHELTQAIHDSFKDVPYSYTDAMGQLTDDGEVRCMLTQNWLTSSGVMVKWLAPGPGILASVNSTEALTAVMAQHHWMMLDGDMA